ncbi:MAG: hypothetical protein KKD36_04625 [Bacteroidetes bacterium]|nr:hypothetical protein [Bacteroidota bacterium]
MKNGKKKLVSLLALVLLFSLSFNAFASENKENNVEKKSVSEEKEKREKVKGLVIENYSKIEKTKKGLLKYKQDIEKKNTELSLNKKTNALVTITFNKPLSLDELKDLSNNYNLDLKQVQSRYLVDEQRFTTSTLVQDAKLNDVDMNSIAVLNDLTNEYIDKSVSFIGYTDVYAVINTKDINKVEKNTDVFLIDSSADSYFISENEQIFPHALTWDLEDTKLID